MLLKTYGGSWEDLCLYFEITVGGGLSETRTVELIRGGGDILVTSKNVIRYISLVSNYRLNVQLEAQCRSFLRGFQDIIPKQW